MYNRKWIKMDGRTHQTHSKTSNLFIYLFTLLGNIKYVTSNTVMHKFMTLIYLTGMYLDWGEATGASRINSCHKMPMLE